MQLYQLLHGIVRKFHCSVTYVRVPGKRPPLAVCNSSKPPANQGLQGSCYRIDTWECFKMMRDMSDMLRTTVGNQENSRKFKKDMLPDAVMSPGTLKYFPCGANSNAERRWTCATSQASECPSGFASSGGSDSPGVTWAMEDSSTPQWRLQPAPTTLRNTKSY